MVDRSPMEAALYFQKPKYPFVASPYARRRQLLSEVAADCFILPELPITCLYSAVKRMPLDLGSWILDIGDERIQVV